MNFTAHRMNTGLSDIFNENSVEKLLKNDSSPQTTNLARINTGIAEMLFGRTETPKGIGTYSHTIPPSRKSSLEEQKPQRGLELKQLARWYITICLEEQKPQRGLKLFYIHCSAFTICLFGRTETPKGIETYIRLLICFPSSFGRTETPKGIETDRQDCICIHHP